MGHRRVVLHSGEACALPHRLAVSVAHQGKGLGQLALADARDVAKAWPADAIRLDAYDAPAGGGGFYAKCGYEERGHVVYRRDPLVYYELLLR